MPKLKKVAIWGYYRGAQRQPGDHGGATVILHTEEKQSWFWYIPLSDGSVSIGCVGNNDDMLKTGLSPQEMFDQELVQRIWKPHHGGTAGFKHIQLRATIDDAKSNGDDKRFALLRPLVRRTRGAGQRGCLFTQTRFQIRVKDTTKK